MIAKNQAMKRMALPMIRRMKCPLANKITILTIQTTWTRLLRSEWAKIRHPGRTVRNRWRALVAKSNRTTPRQPGQPSQFTFRLKKIAMASRTKTKK